MFARIPGRLLPFGLLVLSAGCQTEGARYNSETAGLTDSSGFWTVLIAVLTFIVGFLVGATASRNGGIRIFSHRHHHHRRTQAGWDRLARHIQEGTKQGLSDWRSLGHTGHAEDPDWSELSRTIEERVLEEMHKHHD